MIISDQHRFAFVHVPKCAGTSVRVQLKRFDKYGGRFARKAFHPELGFVDYSHLPLQTLREHFPETFEEVRSYRSFALVREPQARFLSAVRQRIGEFRRVPEPEITPAMVLREAEAVIEHLAGNPHTLDAQYIHFRRQADYVFCGPEQVVRHVLPIGRGEALERFVRETMAPRFSLGLEENVSRIARRPRLGAALQRLRPAVRGLAPPALKATLWALLERLGVFERSGGGGRGGEVPSALRRRIHEHYRADAELYVRVSTPA